MSDEFIEQLIADGVASSNKANLRPLKGGVSSDIYLLEDEDRRIVVKRALPQLKVEAEWFADVSRNETERLYIQHVAKTNPFSVPKVLAVGENYFAMEYFGEEYSNWKVSMLCGRFSDEWPQKAGAFLGDVHRYSRDNEALAEQFDKMDSFWQLRIEPYLIAASEKHPELDSIFVEEAVRLRSCKLALVHGDFSPKNILVSKNRLVVLDCEVANYGDPAFDVAFLLTHLFLKMLYHKNYYAEIKKSVRLFLEAYGVFSLDFEARTGRLLMLLLIARVDGKSPVEYLTDSSSVLFLRSFARLQLIQNPKGLIAILEEWEAGVKALRV